MQGPGHLLRAQHPLPRVAHVLHVGKGLRLARDRAHAFRGSVFRLGADDEGGRERIPADVPEHRFIADFGAELLPCFVLAHEPHAVHAGHEAQAARDHVHLGARESLVQEYRYLFPRFELLRVVVDPRQHHDEEQKDEQDRRRREDAGETERPVPAQRAPEFREEIPQRSHQMPPAEPGLAPPSVPSPPSGSARDWSERTTPCSRRITRPG